MKFLHPLFFIAVLLLVYSPCLAANTDDDPLHDWHVAVAAARHKTEQEIADLKPAAEGGDAKAQFQVGTLGLKIQHWDDAAKWLLKSANNGYAGAQVQIGILYQSGMGVEQDYTKALKWFRKAADQGDTGGMSNIAAMYEEGKGVPKSPSIALEWYTRALHVYEEKAKGGDLDAELQLANMYSLGMLGVHRNYTTSIKWFKAAADQDNPTAEESLGAMYAQGLGVKQDWAEALFWCSVSSKKEMEYWIQEATGHLSPAQRKDVENRVTDWRKTHPRSKI